MKGRLLLSALLITLASAGTTYAHDGDKCCKQHHTSCARHDHADDCDFCNGLFSGHGWGGRREWMWHQHEECCTKEGKSKACSMKDCKDDCEWMHHSRAAYRAHWRYHHYMNADHEGNSDEKNG
jgi:hypothetical protein